MDGLAPDELLARGVVSAPPSEKGWVPWEAEELRDEFEGRFHIKRMLGRGGMGAVYLAQDRQLSRSVAIKMLPRAPAEFWHPTGSILTIKMRTTGKGVGIFWG